MVVTRINHFEAKQDTIEKLHTFMQGVVAEAATLPGCRSIKLLRSTENPAKFAIIEEWDSIEAHQKAVAAIPPKKFEEAKTLVARQPVGEYYK